MPYTSNNGNDEYIVPLRVGRQGTVWWIFCEKGVLEYHNSITRILMA